MLLGRHIGFKPFIIIYPKMYLIAVLMQISTADTFIKLCELYNDVSISVLCFHVTIRNGNNFVQKICGGYACVIDS